MKQVFILVMMLSMLVSCKQKQTIKEKQKEIENGSLNERNEYSAAEIGWKTVTPDDWQVLTKKEKEEMTKNGASAIKKATDLEIADSSLIELINLQKDRFNSLLSTIQPYEEVPGESYETNNETLKELIKKTYESNNIKADYASSKETIDGLEFLVFSVNIYSPDKSKIILSQKMYSRILNGYDFGITMVYNNEKDKEVLEKMIHSSTFSKRK